MRNTQLLFVFSLFISFLFSPVFAAPASVSDHIFQHNNRSINAGAGDFFNAFTRDLGKAFRDIKGLVTGDADDSSDNQEEQPDNPSDQTALKKTDSSKTKRAYLARQQNREIQQLLADDGYYSGPVDGLAGIRTKLAISQYQQANGLTVNGLPSETLLADLRTRTRSNDASRPAALSAQPEMVVQVPETVEEIELTIQPFGIALGEKYYEEDFEQVFTLYDQDISDASVHPKQPHPLFNQYSISVKDGLIVNIHAAYTASKTRTSGEPFNFNSESECDYTANAVANDLEEKYGQGKRFGKAGKWELIISNPKVQIRYFAKCGPSITATTMSLSFQRAEIMPRKESLNVDEQLKVQQNILEYNHVF